MFSRQHNGSARTGAPTIEQPLERRPTSHRRTRYGQKTVRDWGLGRSVRPAVTR